MSRALRSGLFNGGLFATAALLLAVACSSEDGGSSSHARQSISRQSTTATLPLTSTGRSLVPVSLNGDQLSPKLDLELPIKASGALLLRPSTHREHALGLAAMLSDSKPAVLAADGSAVYERAFGSADLVQSATLDGLHTRIALKDSAVPDVLTWQVDLPQGVRAVPRADQGTDLVNDKGEAWLSVSPVSVVDGQGVTTETGLTFDADGYARLRIGKQALKYPASVQFAVTLGNIQTLAVTPTQIKGRVMVLLDTSGSMLEEFGNATNTHGDSPRTTGVANFCDNQMGNGSGFDCNDNAGCTPGSGALNYWVVDDDAKPSRMLASKQALQNVINAHAGILDFGLERYAEDPNCPNPLYCCNPQIGTATRGRCMGQGSYNDIPNSGSSTDLTYSGSCGGIYKGGRVLIQPDNNSKTKLLPWVDFTEDFCSSTGAVGGAPRNPELRADGNTPLGKAVRSAREDWFQPVYNDSQTDGALDDPLIDCRAYVLVVMTDGDDTCEAGTKHPRDCGGSNAQCVSNRCFTADSAGNDNGARYACTCATNADCPGEAQSCNTATPVPMDCADDSGLCPTAASTCVDVLDGSTNNGNNTLDNWRCSCATSADCGAGFTCNTATTPGLDCHANNNRCRFVGNNVSQCQNTGTNQNPIYRCSCNNTTNLCPASQQCVNGACQAKGVCQASFCEIDDPSPHAQVQALTNVVTGTNKVKTYVLGMGDTGGLDVNELNAMAVAGGTTQARLATNQAQIEAAFADIVADTVKYEVCNTKDDNCNNRVDEGLGVYKECLTAPDCSSGGATPGATCNFGRCANCTSDAQCGTGYRCSKESPTRFCRPACSEGQGACFVAGVRKCGVGVGQCCVDNNSPTCTDIVPPTGTAEVCNGIDDNCNGFSDEGLSCQGCVPLPEVCNGVDDDCDNLADETGPGGLVDVGGDCGSAVGECTIGKIQCVGGDYVCSGTGPTMELCNGKDDDCDGVVDGMGKACYSGAAGTRNVGTCHDGTQLCTATVNMPEQYGACTGEQGPTKEVCNGLDDDCDNVPDNGIPAPTPGAVTGDGCCSDKAPGSKCGTGQCAKGTWQCAGSVVVCANAGVPSNETCDNVDNDCDGTVDNIPTVGGPCTAPGGCSGTLKCDSNAKMLVCSPDGSAAVEVCDGVDNDCDGKTDEIEDISVNDDWYMDDCDAPPAGHDQPPCKPGKWICKNGVKTCDGAVKPLDREVCDLKDNDCDGVGDPLAACPGTNACVQGVCVEPCHGGEFPCPNGYECKAFETKKYCVPTTCNAVECPPGASCKEGACTLDNVGGAGSVEGGDAGAANSGTEGGNGSSNEAGEGSGASNGTAGGGGGGSAGKTGSGANGTGANKSDDGRHGIYGLVTGGGGCACRTAPSQGGKLAAFSALLLLGVSVARRRRGTKGRAA